MKKYFLSGLLALASLATFAQNTQSSISFPSLNKVKIVDADGSSQVLSATATTYRYVSWSRRLIIKEFGQVVFEAHINTVDVDTARSVPGKITLLDLKLAIPSTSSGSGVGKSLADGGGSLTFDVPQNRWVSNVAIQTAGFTGPGGSITNLNASNLFSGTVPEARLSGNVGLLGRSDQTWTGIQRFSGVVRASGAAGGSSPYFIISPSLSAQANNDVLTALEINPTFSPGSFTGVSQRSLRVTGASEFGNIFASGTTYSNAYRTNGGSQMVFGSSGGAIWGGYYTSTGNRQEGPMGVDDGSRLQVAGSVSVAGDINLTGNIVLPATNTYDLATGPVRFRNGYFSNNLYTTNSYANSIRPTNAGNGLVFANTSAIAQAKMWDNGNWNFGSTTSTDFGVRVNIEGNLKVNAGSGATVTTISLGTNASISTSDNTGIVFNQTVQVPNSSVQAGGTSSYFGGTNSDGSAVVTINSTTKGFLPPRMTSAQRTGISSPATGLIVYQTDGTEGIYVKTSTAWKMLTMN